MRVVVTGGAGFIGSHVVDALVAGGDEVVALDNLSSGRRENVNAAAELVVGDLRDAAQVAELFARVQPEVCFHLAAQADVRVSVERPAFDCEVNVVGRSTSWRRPARTARRSCWPPPVGQSTASAPSRRRSRRLASRSRPTASPSSPPRSTWRAPTACTERSTSPCATETSTARARTPTGRRASSPSPRSAGPR